jgi:hypothetical protein
MPGHGGASPLGSVCHAGRCSNFRTLVPQPPCAAAACLAGRSWDLRPVTTSHPVKLGTSYSAPTGADGRGDAVRRPGAVVHDDPTQRDAAVARVRRTARATHRVAPTLPAGRVQVPMNQAGFRVS